MPDLIRLNPNLHAYSLDFLRHSYPLRTTAQLSGQLGGYSVRTVADKDITVKLQKSANGIDWQDVSGSQLTAPTNPHWSLSGPPSTPNSSDPSRCESPCGSTPPIAHSCSDADADADGFGIDGVVQPGTDYYLRRPPHTSATTPTATAADGLAGRVLTGVAIDERSQQLTPVALAIPTDMAIEFDISWEADKTELFGQAETAGDEFR
ncbi:MAG: hypothetical protein JO236_07080 [Mycobacterium sp.]|uniref:hypothetical protein n=1 Tax=Mycobacterium sp. TaxID=1785 RepID=UPI001ECD2200|nr:hypothetical protein [Mycobacterium sp.]MBW0017290.1 hypothetical protein [Mycobacterium sp.]